VIPQTDNGRTLLAGIVLLAAGLFVGLPPLALWGPGAALAVPGALFVLIAFIAPAPPEDAP
jgi:hypothetical protein